MRLVHSALPCWAKFFVVYLGLTNDYFFFADFSVFFSLLPDSFVPESFDPESFADGSFAAESFDASFDSVAGFSSLPESPLDFLPA